jgi:hypothetical protein
MGWRDGVEQRGMCHAYQCTRACLQTPAATDLLYAVLSLIYSWAASGFAGLEQLGSVSMLCMLISTVQMLWQGDHLSCSVSCTPTTAQANTTTDVGP